MHFARSSLSPFSPCTSQINVIFFSLEAVVSSPAAKKKHKDQSGKELEIMTKMRSDENILKMPEPAGAPPICENGDYRWLYGVGGSVEELIDSTD